MSRGAAAGGLNTDGGRMTETVKDEVVRLAFEYMRARKAKDKNREWISRQRILLFMALERAEAVASEPRRTPEEGIDARQSHDGSASDAVTS
jgi:hypothetical protein